MGFVMVKGGGWGGRRARPQAEHGLVISYIINERSWLTILLLVCAGVSLGLTV